MLRDFDEELTQIENMHRYVVQASERDFEAACEKLSEGVDPETFDMGDIVSLAEEQVGIAPWDVASHSGLMAISRAASLAEVMLARMPAQYLIEPERWVFPRNGLWPRQWEATFYRTVLKTPYRTDSELFAAIRALRDLYAHGYGVPATEQRRTRIAEVLHRHVDAGPATDGETRLGYGGGVYFFGWDSSYSTMQRKVTSGWSMSRRADISPLATYRLLIATKEHVHAAYAALMGGFHDDLDEANCKFIKIVLADESRRRTSQPLSRT
ncbi:hypothetical protein DY023_11395 [Microbacterium bovistercoris]|uniref:DUF4942 domain-containing protein n=2 Tax=Microbacterium bovistercoris TaxID=2293570 RepID=A0A371NSU3_9MICO|nr:hypothetical protein DY023_11395 [Microbacterium bovistercoris]